ncbi:YjdF family protein [Actinotignum urinale]|uniref:YjdF family protein n=1 Tax=Actinotignum urinale TaxID=190146 RepID=UPI000C7FE0CB|nr:YjdF family protein [Actinotignum urinale]WIK59290.1 YjdF family protein [Actinotignum urinale]
MFEAPFWIGKYERQCGQCYEVRKVTFGSEPKDYEIYQFLSNNWKNLKFSLAIRSEIATEHKANPKRAQHEINKQLNAKTIGTKAQQALKLQHEQIKIERNTQNKQQREANKERQFTLRQAKKKAKHRGK